MITHLNDLAPPPMRAACAELHRRAFMRYRSEFFVDRWRYGIGWEQVALEGALAARPDLERPLMTAAKISQESAAAACYIEILGGLSAQGLRCFRPTPEQCRAAANIELSLSVMDFAQPFPYFVIQYPEIIRQAAKEHYKVHHAPMYAALGEVPLDNNAGMIRMLMLRSEEGAQIDHPFLTFISHEQNRAKTIEECVATRPMVTDEKKFEEVTGFAAYTEADWSINGHFQRMALNLSLLLCNFPFDERPHDAKQWAKSEKLAKRGDNAAKARIRDMATVIELRDQKIKFHQEVKSDHKPGEPTGEHLRPHWRRGFWRVLDPKRNPRWYEYKRQYIAPVLVNADRLTDPPANSIIYKG